MQQAPYCVWTKTAKAQAFFGHLPFPKQVSMKIWTSASANDLLLQDWSSWGYAATCCGCGQGLGKPPFRQVVCIVEVWLDGYTLNLFRQWTQQSNKMFWRAAASCKVAHELCSWEDDVKAIWL